MVQVLRSRNGELTLCPELDECGLKDGQHGLGIAEQYRTYMHVLVHEATHDG